MKLFVSIVKLVLLLGNLSCIVIGQCQVPVVFDLIDFSILSDGYSFGNSNITFVIHKFFVNCLASHEEKGLYKFSTVTVQFTASDKPEINQTAYFDIYCLQVNVWKLQPFLNSTQFTTDPIVQTTKFNCSYCQGFALPNLGVPTEGDPLHHCVECPSECLRPDSLSFCVGNYQGGVQCCNFYDNNKCTSQCGVNKKPDADFDCQCVPFWNGQNCTICNFTCFNGQHNVNCSGCICDGGYTGKFCDININDCQSANCHNGGTCTDGINDYTCECVAGFTGKNCSTNIDDCNPNPCLNGGTCKDGINDYTCSCVVGFTDKNCSTNIDDCSPNPCLNSGKCTDQTNTFLCTCSGSWIGATCEICPLPNCQICSNTIGECEMCNNHFHLNTYKTCEDDCTNECRKNKDAFVFSLCKFYCKLQKWRNKVIECGFDIPDIKPQDIDLSHKEQWKAAMKQETKLRSAWLKKAKQIFKLPKNRNSNEDYNNKVEKWIAHAQIVTSTQEHWQMYIKDINQTVVLQDFKTINFSKDANLTSSFYSYNEKWLKDLLVFDVEFGNN